MSQLSHNFYDDLQNLQKYLSQLFWVQQHLILIIIVLIFSILFLSYSKFGDSKLLPDLSGCAKVFVTIIESTTDLVHGNMCIMNCIYNIMVEQPEEI